MSVNFSAKPLLGAIQWLLESPVLLDHKQHPALLASALPSGCKPLNQDMTECIRALQDELQGKRLHLLGIYYETLWQTLFRQIPDTRVISCNRQVQAGKRTLGEFDLIYYSEVRQAFIHREMAVKFYLGLPGSDSLSGWFGPGLEDRFDKKTDRLLNHQSVLGQTVEGRHSLEALGITEVIPEILLQGGLFYPFEGALTAPTLLSDQHLRGDWLPVSALDHYLESQRFDAITHLNKSQWITSPCDGPLSAISMNDIHSADWLRQHATSLLEHCRGPAMLAGLICQDEQYRETTRFFLVPDDWEDKAHLRLSQ